jgi:hypothetical protein
MLGARMNPSCARRCALLTAVVAGLVVPAAPVHAATIEFLISVGSCDMSPTVVFCNSNNPHPGLSGTLNRRGHVKLCRGFMCIGDAGEGDPTLKPGHSRRVGRFRCTAHTHSVTCRVIRTGKGFRMGAKHVVRVG